jgi:hypothetical protein
VARRPDDPHGARHAEDTALDSTWHLANRSDVLDRDIAQAAAATERVPIGASMLMPPSAPGVRVKQVGWSLAWCLAEQPRARRQFER